MLTCKQPLSEGVLLSVLAVVDLAHHIPVDIVRVNIEQKSCTFGYGCGTRVIFV